LLAGSSTQCDSNLSPILWSTCGDRLPQQLIILLKYHSGSKVNNDSGAGEDGGTKRKKKKGKGKKEKGKKNCRKVTIRAKRRSSEVKSRRGKREERRKVESFFAVDSVSEDQEKWRMLRRDGFR
jgi:hypothetical protein